MIDERQEEQQCKQLRGGARCEHPIKTTMQH